MAEGLFRQIVANRLIFGFDRPALALSLVNHRVRTLSMCLLTFGSTSQISGVSPFPKSWSRGLPALLR